MNYFVLIIVAVAGIVFGMYIARRSKTGLISEQMEHPTSPGYEGQRKSDNKQKILAYVQEHDPTSPSYEGLKKIQNNDVETLVGQGVFYTPKGE